MSKKDFDEYYKQVTDQYNEMKEVLNEFEEMSLTNLVSPEQIENIKLTMQPIKDNYMALSYVAFLLNKPTRKRKQDTYKRQNNKFLKTLDENKSKEKVIQQNSSQIQKMKGMIMIDELLEKFQLKDYSYETDEYGRYIVDLNDARTYAKVFSRVSQDDDFWEDEEQGYLNLDGSSYYFEIMME